MNNRTDTMTAAEFRQMIAGSKAPTPTSQPTGNRKVKNATKSECDGVVFDSRLERHMHDALTAHGIVFEFQKKYTLQESFRYNGETVRAITYTVDFYLPDHDIAVDTKGISTQQGQLRIKMLKRLFADLGRSTAIELPRTPAECNALTARLLNEKR